MSKSVSEYLPLVVRAALELVDVWASVLASVIDGCRLDPFACPAICDCIALPSARPLIPGTAGASDFVGASCPALLGAEVGCGPPWFTSIVSPPLFELFDELKVFADVDVRELLCPLADVGVTGELSFEEC